MPPFQLLPAGPRAWLIEWAVEAGWSDYRQAARAQDAAAWLRSNLPEGVVTIPGARTVLVQGDGSESAQLSESALLSESAQLSESALRAALAAFERSSAVGRAEVAGALDPRHDELVEVPVVYDGQDLERVAEMWHTDVAGVIARHTSVEFRSAFCGFAPGFSYLSGLPREWALPRLENPRVSVPAGAVAVAASWCAVYPRATPGGWQLLGRTEVVLFDQERPRPALLPPGTRVRFTEQGAVR